MYRKLKKKISTKTKQTKIYIKKKIHVNNYE